MDDAEGEMPVMVPGLVSAEERALLAQAIELRRGTPVQAEELEAVSKWVTSSRIDYRLSEWVLDGRLTVRLEKRHPSVPESRTSLGRPENSQGERPATVDSHPRPSAIPGHPVSISA